jgi:hypothetical protein
VIGEDEAGDLEDHLVSWVNRLPPGGRRKRRS